MEDNDKKFPPTAGVRTDFEKLLQSFTATGTVRYEKFTEKWLEMKMYMLCAGRQSDREVREFMEDCMKIALPFWLPPYTFQLRVGALYLLYGLYNTQPCLPKVKIRVTCKNWNEIMEFQADARRQHHLDVVYVFHKLQLQQAFSFVATHTEMNLEKGSRDSHEEVSTLPENFKEEGHHLKQLFTSDVLEQLSAVHHQYHQMKTALAGPGAKRPDQSLNVVQEELVPNITRALMLHQERQQHAQQGSKRHKRKIEEEDEDSEADPTYIPGMEAKDSQMGQLKAKAFGKVAKASRSRRHRQVTVEDVKSPLRSPRKSPRAGSKNSSKKSKLNKSFEEDEDDEEADISVARPTPLNEESEVDKEAETITVIDTSTGNQTFLSMPKLGDQEPGPAKKAKTSKAKSSKSKVKVSATLEVLTPKMKKTKKQKGVKIKKEKKSPKTGKRKGKS